MMGEYQTRQGVLVEIYRGSVRIAIGGLVVTTEVEKVHAITIHNALDSNSSFYLAIDGSTALLFVQDLAELQAVADVLGIEIERG